MFTIRTLFLTAVLTISLTGTALAEGFALTEWSARGLSLAGGMVGRANDPSALAYNAAGITQLPGTQFMGGVSFVAPYGTLSGEGLNPYTQRYSHWTTNTKPATWMAPHGYLTHQLNDDVWLGFAMFSRFGLGNSYAGNWLGRYNMYDVGLQTVSAVPTVAYKINDIFSVSLGVEFMYLTMYEGIKVPTAMAGVGAGDNDLDLNGQGFGFGVHAGLHAKFNEQWSAGLAYKSQVTQNVYGDSNFARQGVNLLPVGIKKQFDSNIGGTLQMPDSLALGISYKPLDNLSFEVGGVWTRWSTYAHLNIYFDEPSGYRSLNDKSWKDGWNINASVEYSPLDWLTLRAGFWHETPVTNAKYADFMLPTNGRDVASLGLGFNWENWKLDLAYAHIWIYGTDYSESRSSGVAQLTRNAQTSNTAADIYSVSLSYTF